jgi:hypothetical protein
MFVGNSNTNWHVPASSTPIPSCLCQRTSWARPNRLRGCRLSWRLHLRRTWHCPAQTRGRAELPVTGGVADDAGDQRGAGSGGGDESGAGGLIVEPRLPKPSDGDFPHHQLFSLERSDQTGSEEKTSCPHAGQFSSPGHLLGVLQLGLGLSICPTWLFSNDCDVPKS